MNYWYLGLGLLAGLMLPIQAGVNNNLGAVFGKQPLVAAFLSFLIGTLVLGVAVLFKADLQAIPHGFASLVISDAWKWLGGAMGAFFVFTSIFLAPKIGVANMVFMFILGQLMMAMVLDGLGLFGLPIQTLHWTKIVGLLAMLASVAFFMMGKKWLN